ncbi:MAG: hypothetical protein K2O18_04055 [Oscillospiraceae bacterium]|nr:hypothetical protein [Oscillospiraceae bacterium]
MYRITKGGAAVGMTETPTYIKQAENGCYNLCPEPQASGIVFAGNPYHLLGRDGMEDLETVMLEEIDAGAEIQAAKQAASDADGMIVEQEYRLTLLELGLADAGNN